MTTKTAAEQVAEALEQLTDASIIARSLAAIPGVADQLLVDAIDNVHAALERWMAEHDSAPKTASQGGEA